MAKPRSRAATALATLAVLAGAGGLCWLGAGAAASFIEKRAREDVRLALQTAGYDWAQVDTDGLQVRLTGVAPDEVQRFRARTQAATAVDDSRILDEMDVASREALAPPEFEVELLRNDQGISLIGLVPVQTDRAAVVSALRRNTAAPQVTDLLEAADYAIPEGWETAMAFGMRAAEAARRAKISIAPGRVNITAITDNVVEKGRLETELERARPEGLALALDISAPRPVIAPFTLRLVLDDEGPRFDACAADTDGARQQIIDAAIRAGVSGKTGCTIGLGAPSAQWGAAAVQSIDALAALGAGTVTLSDGDVALVSPAEVTQERFDEVAGRLERGLPRGFSLNATREAPVADDTGPIEFAATVSPDGTASLRGRITDERMREAVESFARARFAGIDSSLRSDDSVPGGWTVRVIAALDAMSALKNGTLMVTPDLVTITGVSGDQQASDKAVAALSDKLGAGASYQLSVRYDRRLDPALGLPDGPECVDRLNGIMAEAAIGFEPNKSKIAGDPDSTLERMAGVMTDCADFQIEAGGHTDSQGSEQFNADLSRSRAQAVVKAMGEAGINTANMLARGYGESQPVASNDTEEGREANRRIEFRLVSELPVREGALPAPVTRAGVTGAPAPVPEAPPADATPTAGNPLLVPPAPDQLPPASAGNLPPELQGLAGPGSAATVPLDAGDEDVKVPVLEPDDDTPRPQPRPGGN